MGLLLNRRDVDFMLYEMFALESLLERPHFVDHDRTAIDAVIDTAAKLAEEVFLPHAAKLDQNEPRLVDGRVELIPEVKKAVEAYVEAGFVGASFDSEFGGMQLPWVVSQTCAAYFCAANIATHAYPFLTIAGANLLQRFGSDEQRERFFRPMIEGRWFGTMVLSEPQAGSSLADIRTQATPTADGHYLLNGNKMWTSCADHELAENIVHLVLAKIPGGPPGVKGISLFVVPKFRVDAAGKPGAHNNVVVAGLNHKMGYRGTINAVLNLGEAGECHGWLVGEPHQGLSYMFQMMNEARVGVGLGAVALGYTGYLHSLEYARERPQGRHPDSKDPSSPQVMLVEHADVRRLLLAQKSAVEGGLALALYCAWLLDIERTAVDAAERARVNLLLDLLTPIVKSWPSEFCLEANKHAIQILGGYGYTRDYPLERFYRDNRLNPIHEGAHAIHGIDLLGRKVTMQNGAALAALMEEVNRTIVAAGDYPDLREYADQLMETVTELEATTKDLQRVRQAGEARRYLANASIYLDTFGHVVIAWMWLWQATVAARAIAGGADEAFYRGKLTACRYFYRYELVRVPERLALLIQADDTCLALDPAEF